MAVFEWDEAKAESNLWKHGVDFDDAMEAFYDPHLLIEQDGVVDGEPRWKATGMVGDATVLVVAHIVAQHNFDEVIRIISARRANRTERRLYEQDR